MNYLVNTPSNSLYMVKNVLGWSCWIQLLGGFEYHCDHHMQTFNIAFWMLYTLLAVLLIQT